mmetsp:Transcript_31600/g.58052  ORF Transcript_31600/g.58052 Transcript_31600/m.58052 type:complete len:206 (-) Transcript_31600:35-652(-)
MQIVALRVLLTALAVVQCVGLVSTPDARVLQSIVDAGATPLGAEEAVPPLAVDLQEAKSSIVAEHAVDFAEELDTDAANHTVIHISSPVDKNVSVDVEKVITDSAGVITSASSPTVNINVIIPDTAMQPLVLENGSSIIGEIKVIIQQPASNTSTTANETATTTATMTTTTTARKKATISSKATGVATQSSMVLLGIMTILSSQW